MEAQAAEHLVPGLALPLVSLIATSGVSVCVAALAGRSVVAVYPWTGRPGRPNPPNWDHIKGAHGSTPELKGFRDHFRSFRNHDTRVFGLSGQATDDQQEAALRLALPFPLLSDAECLFAEALDLPRFFAGAEAYLRRLTLVVKDGKIEQVFDPVPEPSVHAAEVLEWLETQV